MPKFPIIAGALLLCLFSCANDETQGFFNDANDVGLGDDVFENGEHDGEVDSDSDKEDDEPPVYAPPFDPDLPFGGERPAEVVLPSDYNTAEQWPLIILLHGYTMNGELQDAYFQLSKQADEHRFITLLPNGTRNTSGQRFWNATNACCDLYRSGVDDVAYLTALIDEALERLAVDPGRVYFMGHSNGGFMSFRMACEVGEKIAAIASLAGSDFHDPDDCAGDEPVAVLQMHGTYDATILYNGGFIGLNRYPGAEDVVERWAERNGCAQGPIEGPTHDFDEFVSGEETKVTRWEECDEETSVELWRMERSSHTPGPTDEFIDHVLNFLFAHQRR